MNAISHPTRQLKPATGVPAVMIWWKVLQAPVMQLRHRTNLGAAWRQPSRAPRQSPPAVTVTAAHFSGGAALHRPLRLPQPVQLRHQRPGAVLQILQVAVAVERPASDAARPAAPVAGLGGARTGVLGLGPARAAAALAEPRAGRDGDLPGPTGLPAAHEASPPSAWLPGSDQPTKQAGTAKPEPHRCSTVLPAGRACRAWSGPAGDRKSNGRRLLHRGGLDLGCELRSKDRPNEAGRGDLALSSSKPRRGRGHTAARQPGAARATPPAAHRHGHAGLASPRSSPWAQRRWP